MKAFRPSLVLRLAPIVCACAGGGTAAPPAVEVGAQPMTPLPLSFHEGLPELDVVVGGEHRSLMLDTGAGGAISLSPELLARLPGVSFTGRSRHFENARGDLLASREFALAELSLGPMTFRGVTGQELAFAADFAPPNRDGWVGRALFARHRLLVDYAARTLTLLTGEPQPIEQPLRARPATPVRIDADGIVVDAVLDGAPARFVLDTGSTHSLLRPRASPGRASRHDLVVCGETLTGFELVEIDAGPPGVDGMLGRSFFEGRRVLLDLAGARMWID